MFSKGPSLFWICSSWILSFNFCVGCFLFFEGPSGVADAVILQFLLFINLRKVRCESQSRVLCGWHFCLSTYDSDYIKTFKIQMNACRVPWEAGLAARILKAKKWTLINAFVFSVQWFCVLHLKGVEIFWVNFSLLRVQIIGKTVPKILILLSKLAQQLSVLVNRNHSPVL